MDAAMHGHMGGRLQVNQLFKLVVCTQQSRRAWTEPVGLSVGGLSSRSALPAEWGSRRRASCSRQATGAALDVAGAPSGSPCSSCPTPTLSRRLSGHPTSPECQVRGPSQRQLIGIALRRWLSRRR